MARLQFRKTLVYKMVLKAAWIRAVHAGRTPEAPYTPFILTGPPRSGTSLLTALLTRKKNVLIANEPVVVGDPLLKRGEPAELLRGYMNLIVRDAIRKGTLLTQVDPDDPTRSTTDTANRGAMRERIKVEVDRTQPLCIGIKHPMPFMECLDELVTGWPDLKVLISIRDPLPTIRSWRETTYGWQPGLDDPRLSHGRRIYKEVPRTEDPLARRAHLWRILAERSLAAMQRRPDQVLVFRYETLLAEPGETMRRLFDFIGAPDPASPINVSDVKPQNRDRYKGLTEAEAATIEQICGEVNARVR